MEIKIQTTSDNKTIRLKDITPGGVFRYHGVSLEDALRDDGIWQVVTAQPAKPGLVFCVNVSGKSSAFRDDDHLVIPHKATLVLDPGE
jgi:hypothetical protein